jgi:hypothetical protein
MISRDEAGHITAIIILYSLLLRLYELGTRRNLDLGTTPLAYFYYGQP